jgi:S1-C subfamily serine protease
MWGVLAVLLALMLYQVLFPGRPPLTTQDVTRTVNEVLASATPPPPYSRSVYQVIQPSLVLIQTRSDQDTEDPVEGLGSGVVVNGAGDVLTALHVIGDATEIRLTFADGSESDAVVKLRQPNSDIAVLGAANPPADLVPATLGNPGALRVGDDAFVVGNPLGLYSSMSAGVISGFGRSFTPPSTGRRLQGLIQFDAAVNPGNSGGPLLNRQGNVVGIVTALANPTEQDVFIGIGLAVPINVAASGAGLPPY